jgi:hypothetical protein
MQIIGINMKYKLYYEQLASESYFKRLIRRYKRKQASL